MFQSQAGLLGAMAGSVLGMLQYALTIGVIVRIMRQSQKSKPAEEVAELERRLFLFRRLVLAGDVLAFAAVGYFLGNMFFQ